jgi:hypothetical protein
MPEPPPVIKIVFPVRFIVSPEIPMLANTFEPSLRRCLRLLTPRPQASAIR